MVTFQKTGRHALYLQDFPGGKEKAANKKGSGPDPSDEPFRGSKGKKFISCELYSKHLYLVYN